MLKNSLEHRQTANNLIIALQEMRARAEKAKGLATQLRYATLADDLQLYVEDITQQITTVNRAISAHQYNVAIAEL